MSRGAPRAARVGCAGCGVHGGSEMLRTGERETRSRRRGKQACVGKTRCTLRAGAVRSWRGRAETGFREGRGSASPRSLTGGGATSQAPGVQFPPCLVLGQDPTQPLTRVFQLHSKAVRLSPGTGDDRWPFRSGGYGHTNSTACIKSNPGTAPRHCLPNGGASHEGGRGGRGRPLLELSGGPVDTVGKASASGGPEASSATGRPIA